MKKIGLTLGKFAPFHLGHQSIIETALTEVDQLIVIIYDTDLTPIPLTTRANWIRNLYPAVRVIEAWDGPVGHASDRGENRRAYEIKEEQFILSLLGNQKITHFYSSEYYGAHMSMALGAEDRRVDEQRMKIPVSGSMIRENPTAYKAYVHPLVYRDMIIKVVFLGAMSTGKSTLTEALAKHYKTSFAEEYGRIYWTEHQVDRRISFEAFNEIAIGHIEREEKAIAEANQYCFIDTNAITTYVYALDYHGKAPEHLSKLANENARRYDLFFLCEDDIPYDDTWDRSGDQKRKVFQQQIIADLLDRRIPFIHLKGDLQTRISRVTEILKGFTPYTNYWGNSK